MIRGRGWNLAERSVQARIEFGNGGKFRAANPDPVRGGNREFDIIVTDGDDFDKDPIANLNSLMRFAR